MSKLTDTFLAVAEDCPATAGVVPPVKEGQKKTVARIQYELLTDSPPYTLTQEDVLFGTHVRHTGLDGETAAPLGLLRDEFLAEHRA